MTTTIEHLKNEMAHSKDSKYSGIYNSVIQLMAAPFSGSDHALNSPKHEKKLKFHNGSEGNFKFPNELIRKRIDGQKSIELRFDTSNIQDSFNLYINGSDIENNKKRLASFIHSAMNDGTNGSDVIRIYVTYEYESETLIDSYIRSIQEWGLYDSGYENIDSMNGGNNSRTKTSDCILLKSRNSSVYILLHIVGYSSYKTSMCKFLSTISHRIDIRISKNERYIYPIDVIDESQSYLGEIAKVVKGEIELKRLVFPTCVRKFIDESLDGLLNNSKGKPDPVLAPYKFFLNLDAFIRREYGVEASPVINKPSSRSMHDDLVHALKLLSKSNAELMNTDDRAENYENNITKRLELLLGTNRDSNFVTKTEECRNNGYVDLILESKVGEPSLVIECKRIEGSFDSKDSEALKKALYQLNQYLANHQESKGYVVLYLINQQESVALEAVKQTISKINIENEDGIFHDKTSIKFEENIKGKDIFNRDIPVHGITVGEQQYRLLMCELHTKGPSENFNERDKHKVEAAAEVDPVEAGTKVEVKK